MKQVLYGTANDTVGTWVAARLGHPWIPGSGTAIGLSENGRLIAGTTYVNCNGASLWMNVAAEPGKRWLNKAFLWTSFAYPFLQLQMKKVLVQVSSSNYTSRRFVEGLGFRLEATLKDADPLGSLMLYSMAKADCRWLNIKVRPYGQRQFPPTS